jgi:hypothetical protein
MSEDKAKDREEDRRARTDDDEPDVEAHRFKARSDDPGEDAGEDESGMRLRRPSGL